MFVDTIGTNDLKRSVLDAIIVFGRESGMEMIAEGVESQLQVDYLSQHGVYLNPGLLLRQAHAAEDTDPLATGVAVATPAGQLTQRWQDLAVKRFGQRLDIIRLMLAVAP